MPLTRIVRFFVPLSRFELFDDIITCFDTGASLDLISSKLKILQHQKIEAAPKTQISGAFGGNSEILGTTNLCLIIDDVIRVIQFGVVKTNSFQVIIGMPTICALKIKIEDNNVFSEDNRVIGKKSFAIYQATNNRSHVSHIENFFNKNKFNKRNENKLREIFFKHSEAFSKNNNDVSMIPAEKFTYKQEFFIDDPPAVKIYKVDREKSELMHAEIEKLLKMGILEESKANVVTSNLLAVKKPDGGLRIVTDLRLVNKYTKPCNLALPEMRDIMDKLSGKKYFCKFDVLKAFWTTQVPENQRCWYTVMSPKTRVIYQYTRMPMGHCHSAVHFQKMIDTLIRDAKIENTFSYIDDVICGFPSENDLFNELEKLLGTFAKNNLKLSLDKTKVLTKTLKTFGYEISEEGIKPDQQRIEKLLKIPLPTTKKDLLSILASFNYYRTSIRNFAHLSSKLYAMTGSKSKFNMTEDMANCFHKLQQALANHILATPIKPMADFILETDASIYGTGAVLKQTNENGIENIIAVDSNSLKGNQKVWAINQIELLGVYQGLLKFERIIGTNHVRIRVDNSVVFWVLSTKLDEIEISKRVPASRFLLYISTFDYSVEHVSGIAESFKLTDALSRAHKRGEKLKLAVNSKNSLVTFETNKNVCNKVVERDINEVFELNKPIDEIHKEISLAQMESKQCIKLFANLPKNYIITNKTLYKKTSAGPFIYCPNHYIDQVLNDLHRHESARKLVQKISVSKIWIPKKYSRVRSFVTQCNTCDPARSKRLEQIDNNSIPNPSHPFQNIAIDLTGYGQDKFILVIVDILTKYVIAQMLHNSTSKTIIKCLMASFTIYGLPSCILTDNAANLTSEEIKSFTNTFGIVHKKSSVMNSRGNAYAEAAIKRLQNKLRIYQPNESELGSFLNIITFILNTEKVGSSQLSAFEKMFHREASWIRQIPQISPTKKITLKDPIKTLFEEASRIQEMIL